MNSSSLRLVTGLLMVVAFSRVHAADWPQWRGPARDGRSSETGLLQQWPKDGPPLIWESKEVGHGYSTPAVVGDRLFLLGSSGPDDESLLAVSAADGRKVWSTRVGKVGPNQGPQYPGPRSTPTVDGERMFTLGSDGDLLCAETASGKVIWTKNLRAEFKGAPGNWAYAESPLVDGNLLFCTPGGPEATMVALDKKTGAVIWKSAVPGGDQAAYASAIRVEVGGVAQYVQFLGKGLVGVEAKSGRLLWRYDRTAQGSPANIPSPVAQGDYVYSAAGRSGGGLIKLSANRDKFEASEVYFNTKLPTAIGGAVLVGDYLYGTAGQALLCVQFTSGRVQWEDRSVAPGAVCYADRRLYLHGENGQVALVEATSEGYREKGRFMPPNPPPRGASGSKAWAYPVVANGRLWIRDLGVLWCYDVRDRQARAAAP